MRQTKPLSFLDTFLCTFFAVFMAIPNVVWADALTQVTIVPTPVPAAPPGTPLTFKLEVSSTTNGVACLVQIGTSLTSTNPADWHTLLSVKPSLTNTVTIPGFQATNHTAFFRLAEFLAQTDTNAPAWSNVVGGRFTFQQVSNLWAQWNAASDNFGVASYRVYLGTNLFTNVLGNTLSCILPVTIGQRADIRIQAVDASDNATDILSLAYLPGDKLVAVGDENGRAYLMQIQADGTFSAPRQIADFTSPDWGAGFGDFDRDGILDLITGHGGNNTMTPFFFKGRADGTSESPVPLPTSPGANTYMMGATVGDFDCDGRLDFVVNGNDRYIYFYWGNGDGTFTLDRRDWAAYGQYGRAMSAGDFNEDGRDDLVRATASNGQVRLYLSNGDRTFSDTNLVGVVGDNPYTAVAGDFDEDGHLDLIVNAGISGDVTFFKGRGDGTFTNLGVNGDRKNLDLDNHTAMSTADYNQDGHLDLVVVNYTGHSVYFFAGVGNGTFTNRVTLATGLGNTLGVASPPLPPRVNVAISPTDPITNLNQALPFQATGSGATTNDLFRWTFGDQGTNPLAWTFTTNLTNMGQAIAHTYTNEGRFVTRLLHTTTNSTTTNAINSARGTWVTIFGQPPVANAGGPYLLGEQAATQRVWTATLDGSASYDDFGITNYFWTFGDGTFLNNGPIVSHSWSNAGAWNIGLAVADTVGQTGSNATTVTFAPGTPPVAVIDGPVLLNETAATNGAWYGRFFGTNSTDDSGRIWTYAWNLGNSTTATGVVAQAIYGATGAYTVALTVMDHAGQTNSATQTVTVQADAPPVAAITGPAVLDETFVSTNVWRATFYGTNSTDDRGIWKYAWNFGNGTTGTGSSAQGAFTSTGNYVVTLTVTDHAGQTNATTFPITVKADAPPVPVITGPSVVDETYASNGVWRATFSGGSSTDDRGIWKYAWNFGNGATGTGTPAQTTFSAAGNYTVTLTVTDHAGQAASTNLAVQVKANSLPTPVITGPRLITEATATNHQWFGAWNGQSSTDDRGIYRYEWNFGDGTTGTGSTVTHAYSKVDLYRLVLTVTDFGNQTMTTTQNVAVIAGKLPQPQIVASSTNPEGAYPVTISGLGTTDDRGVASFSWTLPPRKFTFDGQYLDQTQWRTANTRQNDKLIVTGQNSWGTAYFFSPNVRLQRGASIEGRVDTSSGSTKAMIGLRNVSNSSGSYNQLVYAIYFNDGVVQIFESDVNRGSPTNYTRGSSYDFRIETKPGAGARYFLRPSDQGQGFVKVFETSTPTSDNTFGFGADVYSGAFAFDDLTVDGIYISTWDFTTGFSPGGPVTLEVVDHAGQTNTATLAINPITGTPPVALIVGSTNAPAGVELAYHGYYSTDDHLPIASYTWDFGDGSPLAFGPAVSHAYTVPGIYTNTLTVRDYAGQPGVATALVFVGAGNQLVCVPWRIIGGVEYPHETYAGKTNTLKAVARGVPLPFDYIWDFGDGSVAVTNTATTTTAAYGLQSSHAYSGADGTPYNATIRISLTNGTTLVDTYPILLRQKTIEVERNVAIDEGLWYLHKIQSRVDLDSQNKGGSWTYNGGQNVSATASSVHALGINGHVAYGDPQQDPYVETVQRGVNTLLMSLRREVINQQNFGDPDGNHNGIALSANNGSDIYQTGPLMDALVAATSPDLVATVGNTEVKGRTYRDIMQDLVDVYAWGQRDYNDDKGGAWRYSWNDQQNDNSASQWAAIGLYAAEHYWAIPAPQWVKERNVVWLVYSHDGFRFGYAPSFYGSYCVGEGNCYATTPSGLVQLAYDQVETTNYLWQNGENFLAREWSGLMSGRNIYAYYAIAKAMRTAVPNPVQRFSSTQKDWFFDPNDGLARTLVDRQGADGTWTSSQWVDVPLATAWSIIILSSSLFQRGPVAVAQARPNPTAVGFPVVFDGRNSFHQHPAGRVVEYRWDFDASNGLDFDHPDAYGPVVTNRFGFLGTNIVTLQVRDNFTPQLSDTASIEVRTTMPPYPPNADAGGPYIACVGQDVHVDGSGSFDVDTYIQSWSWEVSFQMPLDFNDGLFGAHAVITNGFATAGQHRLGLRVVDATSLVFTNPPLADLADTNFATVFVYNRVITNLFGRAKDNKIQLVWNPAGDYAVVTRSTAGPDRGFAEIGRTASTYATFLDTNVDYNLPYYYRIYAYQNGQDAPLGLSDPVNVVSIPRSFESCGPYFTATPPHEASVGQLYEVYLQAKERQNNPFSYVMLAGPTNMTLNTTNGLVSYQPAQADLGEQFVSFAVTNFCGTNTLSYTLTVFNLTNLPPIVNIHGPYTGVAGQPVQLSSAGTFDPDTNALTYVWAFGDGTIDTNANPTHAYPAEGTYNVALYVNDGHGGTATAQTTATITRANRIPISYAGPNLMPFVGQTVKLDGSGSWDADLDPLNYRWELVMRPTNSTSTLVDATTARPSLVIDRPGFYVAQLIVNDGHADSTPDGVTIITANSPPIANAGRDQRVLEGNTATLDGTASSDVDLDRLTYRWSLVSKPTGSTATLTNATAARPTFGVDLYGLYRAELIVNDGLADSAPDQVIVTTGNLIPVIVSTPAGTNAVFDHPWLYTVQGYDLDSTNLTFTLVDKPSGMTITPQPLSPEPGDTNSALISWTPTRAQEGVHPVRIRVTDGEGAGVEQAFTLAVSRDIEPPQVVVALIAGEVNQYGQWAAKLGTTPQFRVLATDNIGVTNKTLFVAGRPVALDASGVGSVTASNAGLWRVLATATDAEGNVGTTNTSVLFYDPTATNTIFARILSPAYGQVVTKPVPVIGTITNATDLFSYRVDFARAADVDLGYISAEGPQFTTLTNVLLPPGTRSITNAVLAQFDPTMLLNDEYVIRLVVSDGRSLWYEPAIVSVSGNLKFGEFHLEFTDLAVPVAGIPIKVTRVYDTRQANQTNNFGYGWSLGVQDAKIRKTLRSPGWTEPTMFPGSRVYLNIPDGRRVGFTVNVDRSVAFGFVFVWLRLDADPGVYEKLEMPENTAVYYGGYFLSGLADSAFNPSTFLLTTKDGTVYTYHDTKGLQNVRDLNGNQLVLNRDGVYHFSVGSTNWDVSVPFIRDAQGRITEIIDPAGKRLTYAYDARGDLRSFTDQVTNVTQYLYSTARAHYLTNIIDPLGHPALKTIFDDQGRLVAVTDAMGHTLYQDFNLDQNAETFTDAKGNVTIEVYDNLGNVVTKTDGEGDTTTNAFEDPRNPNMPTKIIYPNGETAHFDYNERGGLIRVTDPAGNMTLVSRNERDSVTKITDPAGNSWSYDYDSYNRLTTLRTPKGGVAVYSYDNAGNRISQTDPYGNKTRSSYTPLGLAAETTLPTGAWLSYQYNQLRQKVAETVHWTDAAGLNREATATWTYDARGHLTSQVDALGNSITNELDATGKIKTTTDGLGRETHYQYDDAGRLKVRSHTDGSFESFDYDSNGDMIQQRDRQGRIATHVFDKARREVSTRALDGTLINRTLDPLGHATLETQNGAEYRYTYGPAWAFGKEAALGIAPIPDRRPTGIQEPGGLKVEFGQDANGGINRIKTDYSEERIITNDVFGLPQSVSIPGESPVGVETDTSGRVVGITDTVIGTLNYEYAPSGKISQVTDANGGRTAYSYDMRGRRVAMTDANNRTTKWDYDEVGRVISRELPGKAAEAFTYVGDNLLKEHVDAGGRRTTLEYNAKWQLSRVLTDGHFTKGLEYDDQGRLVAAQNRSGTFRYSYDQNGLLAAVVYPTGLFVRYGYDSYGRVIRLETKSYATTYTYDTNGSVAVVMGSDGSSASFERLDSTKSTKWSYKNGVTALIAYNAADKVSSLTVTRTNGQAIGHKAFGYGGKGVLESIADSNAGTFTMAYNKSGWLVGQKSASLGLDITFTLDACANRIKSSDGGFESLWQYDAGGALVQDSQWNYVYDANGNLLTRTSGGLVWRYTFDEEQRLQRVITPEGSVVEYEYDPNGNLYRRVVDGVPTIYVCASLPGGAYPIEKYDKDGGPIESLVRCSGRLLWQKTSSGSSYYHLDQLGSVWLTTDASGDAKGRIDYDSYGGVITETGSDDIEWRYLSCFYDKKTGLLLLGARFYDTATGRFCSRDPQDGKDEFPITWNPYLYGGGNPYAFRDVTGREFVGEGFLNRLALQLQGLVFGLIVGTIALVGSGLYSMGAVFNTTYGDGNRFSSGAFGSAGYNFGLVNCIASFTAGPSADVLAIVVPPMWKQSFASAHVNFSVGYFPGKPLEVGWTSGWYVDTGVAFNAKNPTQYEGPGFGVETQTGSTLRGYGFSNIWGEDPIVTVYKGTASSPAYSLTWSWTRSWIIPSLPEPPP